MSKGDIEGLSGLSPISGEYIHQGRIASTEIVVDGDSGLFIVHPDILIAPTKISESISCARRGVISERVKSFGESSEAAVMGCLKHSFMEVCCLIF